MARYDIENFMAELVAFLKTQLNAQIVALNAEKNDGFVLREVNAGAYVFQSLDRYNASFDPTVFIGIRDVLSTTAGNITAKQYQVEVVLIAATLENDDDDLKQTLRYHRVVEDLFAANWARIGRAEKIKITSLIPLALALNDASQRAVGATLTFNLT